MANWEMAKGRIPMINSKGLHYLFLQLSCTKTNSDLKSQKGLKSDGCQEKDRYSEHQELIL